LNITKFDRKRIFVPNGKQTSTNESEEWWSLKITNR